MNNFRFQFLFFCFLGLLSSGCYGLTLGMVDASVQKPSNVAVYFALDTKDGNPVAGVEADQFEIYEDGNLISHYESKQTILNPEVATVRYTLLLLDMSGSVVDSGQVPLIQEAVQAFTESLGEDEHIAIYAFDGRKKIQSIIKFKSGSGQLATRISQLSTWQVKDPSTNLNGAIIESIKIIEKAKKTSDVPLRFGNLVIFTDGTDRAHRATSQEAQDAIERADVDTFVIGLGGEIDQREMKRFGKDGYLHVTDKAAVVEAFEEIAKRIKDMGSRYYLLSYCSPSRAGVHELQIEVKADSEQGKLIYEFNAKGFKAGCDPNTPPKFNTLGKQKKPKKKHKSKSTTGASAQVQTY